MASHRKPRPGGAQGAGIRTPALATAALTSVAVLSQTAEAVPETGHGRPSAEEVERKIDDLYRRAESAAEASAASRERGGRAERGTGRTERAGRGAGWAELVGGRSERAERGAGRAERTERGAGWAERAGGRADGADGAEASRRGADSLQRLRDEVARRAQHRALTSLRGMIPAQRGTDRAERGPAPARPVRDPAVTAPVAASARTAAAARPAPSTAVTRATADTAPAITAATPDTVDTVDTAVMAPAGERPHAAASGPKAAKAAVQKKLAHARVLLSERAVQAAVGSSGSYATKARKAIAFARAQLGKPCVWGAAGPDSYDCAGLVQAAWKSAGVTLPRTVRELADAGTPVAPADARPGDLVFFHDDARHVGLCTGDGMMIHAPRPGAYVREEPVSGTGEPAVHSVVRPG
ncbi:NlpC/P60 family protein [Streptomyces tricolor]|uniref:NlpC/P60 family protein n=1 Tax=Streptomyces tricolor TaxID=68277 RepID=UPI0036ED330F